MVYFGSNNNNLYALGHSTANATNARIYNNTLRSANVTAVVYGYNHTFFNNKFKNATMYYVYSNSSNSKFNRTNANKAVGYRAEGNFYDDVYSYSITDRNADGFGDAGTNYPYNGSRAKWFGPGGDWGPMLVKPRVSAEFSTTAGRLMTAFNCTFNFSDPDSRSATVTARLIRNTTAYTTFSSSVNKAVTKHLFLRPAIAKRAETLSCYVVANDGAYRGENFTNITISNTPPSFYEPVNDSSTLLLLHFDQNNTYGMRGEIATKGGVKFENGRQLMGLSFGSVFTKGNDYIRFYNNATNATDYNLDANQGTLEMWIKPKWWSQNNTAVRVFFDYRGTSTSQNRILLRMNRNRLECTIWANNRRSINAQKPVKWKESEWHHVACTWDENVGVKLYVDGSLAKSMSKTFWGENTQNWMYIGTDGAEQSWGNAVYDELRISSVVRTSFRAVALSSPENRTHLEVNTTTWSWNSATDRDSDALNYSLQVDNNPNYASPELNMKGNLTATSYSNAAPGLMDDTYYWRARPGDNNAIGYGNWSFEYWLFDIDAVPPYIWNSSYGARPVYNDYEVNFTTRVHGGDIHTVWYGYNSNGGTWTNYTDGVTNVGEWYNVTLSSGNFSNQDEFNFRWYANDTSGNLEVGELLAFVVQNRAPSKPNLTNPANNSVTTLPWRMLNWSNVTDPDAGNGGPGKAVFFTVYGSRDYHNVSASHNTTLIYNGTNLYYNWSYSTGGTYHWKVVADDGYDTNESEIHRFIYNTAPNITGLNTYNQTLTQKSSFSRGNMVRVRMNVTDLNGGSDINTVIINITDATGAVKVKRQPMTAVVTITNGYTYEYNYTIPGSSKLGTWTVNVYANDTQGSSNTNSTTFTVTTGEHIMVVKLTINNTANTVYVPGVGASAASAVTPAEYAKPPHFYLASYTGNSLKGLVYSRQSPFSILVNKTSANHSLTVKQNISQSQTFLVFTRGQNYNTIENRILDIEHLDFLTRISPSFSFGLGLYYPIKIILKYTDIDIQTGRRLSGGQHRLVFESNKTSTGQKAIRIREN